MLALLGTVGCHLCDDAERVLQQLSLVRPVSWQHIDIALDETLCEQFAEHIPVLRLSTGDYVYWPFSVLDIERALAFGITPAK
ncbi:MAG: glutaredoxin family protein [Paraperlucidibaca sp.]